MLRYNLNAQKNIVMENIRFHGTILAPIENLPTKLNFVWIGTVRSESDEIDIIAFRTDSKDNFQQMLEEDLHKLETMEETSNIASQKAFIKKMLSEMEDGSAFRKEPPQIFLDAANNLAEISLRKRGEKLKKYFEKDNIIYLSGVVM